ncbi:MAG TPA: (2Fe-2S)-binding protein [Chthoniobacteraceae bacterium]|nr:(2Fe-2S)-binding protein [Chthoniobacteraceae bacterium]
MPRVTELHVNGRNVATDADPERPLLSVLRDDLSLTGCKYGCGEGQCGACTVLVDGAPKRSCIAPVGTIGAAKITTVEALAPNGKLHPVQQAFLKVDALQCGYCTPGMVMASVALLREKPNPSHDDIVKALDGQICRCGAYTRIIAAVKEAAGVLRNANAK